MYMTEKEFKDWNKIPEKDAEYMCSHKSCGQKPTHYVETGEYFLVLCDEHFAEWTCAGATPEALLGDLDKADDGIPIVYCTHRKDYPQGLEFFCIFCGRVHKHGSGEGHRVAHCTNNFSPFKKTGYYLEGKK